MNNFFLLPSLVRMSLLLILNVILVVLSIRVTVGIKLSKERKSLTVYSAALILASITLQLARTPLISDISSETFDFLGYFLLFPMAAAINAFLECKKKMLLVDFAVLALNLPFWFAIAQWRYVYIFSVGYFFVQTIIYIAGFAASLQTDKGKFSVKNALDTLPAGVLFSNRLGQITYINEQMHKHLSSLNINEYSRSSEIWNNLVRLAAIGGRRMDDDSVIVLAVNLYLAFYRQCAGDTIIQIVCRDVTAEERAISELEVARHRSELLQEDLKRALNDITRVESQKELLRMKGNLHDVMAQRLSILHGIVAYNNSVDLVRIKSLILSMLPELYESGRLTVAEKISEVIESYSLIGVTLIVKGELGVSDDSRAYAATKLLRECTTNAVRHGGADRVEAEISNDGKHITITITDNGKSTPTLVEGNGITSMRYTIEALGGSISVENLPRFTVRAFIPLVQ